ncbi:2-dehydropantoate 2-reductase [Boudabousia tangfeifanii]|uniref:2-dehydropantoate 2-reductase n=1 Tax=Boudabousia tangfeifanii TaxID=1912795 RepID=A0A1D9MIN3_9ACTO|nr:2-dehydropantoate 2-reductase [Boudabousia tangfeifanii]AOZ72201.1 2-dehydropantoate 2-reductase [Boudabousia tangfeifanii]
MRVAIAGSGAMGCRFGYMMSEAGHEVVLLDRWQEHIDAINANGLRIDWEGEDRVAHLPIMRPEEATGDFDLVICFTKALGLDPMLKAMQSVLKEHTMVLCLLNGIGHEETVSKYVPASNFLLGTTIWTAGLNGPGHAHLYGSGTVALQNTDGTDEGVAAAKRIAEVMDAAGLNTEFSANVKHAIYRKAALNGVVNGLCALLDCNLQSFGDTVAAAEVAPVIVSEFAMVAALEGIEMDQEEVNAYIRSIYSPEAIGEHYPSLHQDLIQQHRLTEIDFLNGAVARKAKAAGLRAPYCELVTYLVHAKEQLLGAK